jgi:hypothetical protein
MWIVSLYKLWFVEIKVVAEENSLHDVPMVETMLFYVRRVVCKHAEKTVFTSKPANNSEIGSF